MAGFWQFATLLKEQINATAWRSDVLKPLAWLIAMLIALTVMLAIARAPEWLLTWAAVSLLATIALYGLVYAICFFIDRDALRSESYSLNKIAIEQKLIGDNGSGMLPITETIGLPTSEQAPKRIGRRPSKKNEGDE